jgi:hypothetical protein
MIKAFEYRSQNVPVVAITITIMIFEQLLSFSPHTSGHVGHEIPYEFWYSSMGKSDIL